MYVVLLAIELLASLNLSYATSMSTKQAPKGKQMCLTNAYVSEHVCVGGHDIK